MTGSEIAAGTASLSFLGLAVFLVMAGSYRIIALWRRRSQQSPHDRPCPMCGYMRTVGKVRRVAPAGEAARDVMRSSAFRGGDPC